LLAVHLNAPHIFPAISSDGATMIYPNSAVDGMLFTHANPHINAQRLLPIQNHRHHHLPLTCHAVSADGRFVAAATEDHEVHVVAHHPEVEERLPPKTRDLTPDGHKAVRMRQMPREKGRGWEYSLEVRDAATDLVLHTLEKRGDITVAKAFHPNSRLLACTSNAPKNSLQIWDLETGVLLHQLEGPGGSYARLAFTPDGRLLVAGGSEGRILAWDPNSGREIHRLEGHSGEIRRLVFARGGQLVISASKDGTARVWDLEHGRELHCLTGHRDAVQALALSPDERLIATGGVDRSLRLWEIATGKLLRFSDDLPQEVQAAAFSPDGGLIACRTGSQMVQVLDAVTLQPILRLPSRLNSFELTFAADGLKLATSGSCTLLRAEADVAMPLWYAEPGGKALAGSGARALFVHDSSRSRVTAWHMGTGKPLTGIRSQTGEFSSFATSSDGRFLALAGNVVRDRRDHYFVRVIDARTGEEIRMITDLDGRPAHVAFNREGTRLAAVEPSAVKVWNLDTGERIHVLVSQRFRGSGSYSLCPDLRRFAIGHARTVTVLDIATGNELLRIAEPSSSNPTGYFSPDGKTLATVPRHDKPGKSVVRVWNLETGQLVQSFFGMTPAAFHPSGQWLACTGLNSIDIWDIQAGNKIKEFRAHRDSVQHMVFCGDGSRLATCDGYKIKVWDSAPWLK
jgi:WD40 repeat protein